MIAKVVGGLRPEGAARAIGLDRMTWYSWRRRAEAGEEPFLTFLDRISEAWVESEDVLLGRITEAAHGVTERKVTRRMRTDEDGRKEVVGEETVETTKRYWAAAAWLLERTRPAHYARRTEVEHKGDVKHFVLHGVTLPPPESTPTQEDLAELERAAVSLGVGGKPWPPGLGS